MSRRIHLGIIGSGIAATKLHLPALKKLPDLYEIKAVASGHIENAREFAGVCGGEPRVFNNYHHLIVSGLVDAVDVAVPPEMNLEIVEDALRNGIHVICEKPIAENVDAGKKLARLSLNYADRVLMVGESQRYDPELAQINDLIRSDIIGKPVLFDWNVIVHMGRTNEYVNTPWRHNPKHIGGFLSDGGVHHMATLRAIFGEVDEVSSMIASESDYIGSYDTMVMNMKFSNGIFGNYTVSYALDAPSNNSLKIYGTNGTIRATPTTISIFRGDGVERYQVPMVNLFSEEFREFYSAIIDGVSPKLGTPEAALKDLAIIEAGIRSAMNSGTAIRISDLLK